MRLIAKERHSSKVEAFAVVPTAGWKLQKFGKQNTVRVFYEKM
jgi:hypothetical protein